MPNDVIDLRDGLLTVPQAARILTVSRGTVYNLMTNGKLPSLKIGYSRRIPRAALRDLLAASVDTRR